MDTTSIAKALTRLDGDLLEIVDSQEAEEAVGPDSCGNDDYILLGQTDTCPNVWGIPSTPERAEVVTFSNRLAICHLLTALGWEEVPNSVGSAVTFYIPEE